MTNGVPRLRTALARLGLGLWLTTTACAHGGYRGGPPLVDTCGAPEFREFDFWLGEWRIEQQMHGQDDEWLAFPAATERGTRHDGEFTVLPGVRFGRIGEHTSRADLQSLGPGVAVRDTTVELEEGFCTPGTRVYDGTPHVLDLAWQDEARTRVAFVRTSGERWATPRGVRVGATLRTLERTAGAPLTFAGFGWDHGGRLEWQEGRGSLSLDLHIDRSRSDADSSAIRDPSMMGDVSLRSDRPAVRRLPIIVGRLAMTWGEPYDQRDCEQAAMEQPRR